MANVDSSSLGLSLSVSLIVSVSLSACLSLYICMYICIFTYKKACFTYIFLVICIQNKLSCFHFHCFAYFSPDNRAVFPFHMCYSFLSLLKSHPNEASADSCSLKYFSFLWKPTTLYLEMLWCQLYVRECYWHLHICHSFDPYNIAVRQAASSLIQGWKAGGSDCLHDFLTFT